MVDIVVNTINDNVLLQNFAPNFMSKIFFAIMYCMRQVVNCTQRLVNAAPLALKIGINKRFSDMFMITPNAATKFSCFKLPLAVNNVPKIYVTEIDTKLPINI